MSGGIVDLDILLAQLEPVLIDGEFVYVTVPHEHLRDYLPLEPMGVFREPEGITLILRREAAEQACLPASPALRCITMMVHSALEAVGMTAAMTRALTREEISANVVAAHYHDHIFVPAAEAERAVRALQALSNQAKAAKA